MIMAGSVIAGKGIDIINDAREKTSELLSNNYYIGKRAVLHGLLASIVSTVAIDYLFSASPVGVMTSAVYGSVNFAVTAFLIEWHGPEKENENLYLSGGLIFGAGYALSTAFIQTVWKTTLSYKTALPLAVGGVIAAYARSLAWEDEEVLFIKNLK